MAFRDLPWPSVTSAEEQEPTAGVVVASKLGHLPLALALAAAYMRACDVSCADYLQRLQGGARGAEAAAGAELLQVTPS